MILERIILVSRGITVRHTSLPLCALQKNQTHPREDYWLISMWCHSTWYSEHRNCATVSKRRYHLLSDLHDRATQQTVWRSVTASKIIVTWSMKTKQTLQPLQNNIFPAVSVFNWFHTWFPLTFYLLVFVLSSNTFCAFAKTKIWRTAPTTTQVQTSARPSVISHVRTRITQRF